MRFQTNPQPDLLHERSYRTCFEPDHPRRRTASRVPAHPHLHGCQEGIINPATSTFRLGLGGATLLSTRALVAVLHAHWCPGGVGCAVWPALRMLTSYAAWPCPSMAFAPHPDAVAPQLVYTTSTPVLRLMRQRPVAVCGPGSIDLLLCTCMAGSVESIAIASPLARRPSRVYTWDRG